MLRLETSPLLLSLLLALCSACAEPPSAEMCLSGDAWENGDLGSPQMHPGRDCLGCHQDRGEAPQVMLGGTVYEGSNELDDCLGLPGVTLELTDANGVVMELTSNDSGNFVLQNTAIATPYSVKLLYEGRERVMSAMQTELSCNSCHTEEGANGAPGRILAP